MSDRACSPAPPPATVQEQIPDTVDTDVQAKEESVEPPSPATSIAQTESNPEVPPTSPTRSTRRKTTEGQRRGILRNDPQAQEMEPQRVLCRACQKWIRLSPHTSYSLSNWQSHKLRCPKSSTSPQARAVRRTPSKPSLSPSSRVATAERQIMLFNDPQVKLCSAGYVQCGNCMSMVSLESDINYDLMKWTEHKEKCIPMTPAPITPQGSTSHRPRVFPPPSASSNHSHISAARSARSPTPTGEGSQSTETTAVTQSSPAAVKVGTKRGREEEQEDHAAVARPTNRPRTERDGRPEKDAPNLFGWFVQPLKEFARGFREGLGST